MLHISCGTWSIDADAMLFDLDGTLVDTSLSVLGSWQTAAAQLDVPFASIQAYMHGIPAPEVLARAAPTLPESRRLLVAHAVLAQQASPDAPASAIPGATDLLKQLPPNRWAIVTSGDARLAASSLRKASLPTPPVLITADDVTAGKPDPQPYLRATELLGVDSRRCVVFEDSPAGLHSALAAGSAVIALTSTHSPQQLTGASHYIPDLAGIVVTEL